MTPTGLKWYRAAAFFRQRGYTWLWTCGSATTLAPKSQKTWYRRRNDRKCCSLLLLLMYTLQTLPNSESKLSISFFLLWVTCFMFDVYFHFHTPNSSPHILPFFLSLSRPWHPWQGPLPLGVLAGLRLWFTHSVPSGLTGWHKDTQQSWERRARQEAWSYRLIELYITETKLSQNMWVVWVKLFEVQF